MLPHMLGEVAPNCPWIHHCCASPTPVCWLCVFGPSGLQRYPSRLMLWLTTLLNIAAVNRKIIYTGFFKVF